MHGWALANGSASFLGKTGLGVEPAQSRPSAAIIQSPAIPSHLS